MNAKFPFLTRLFGKWEDARSALVDGLDQMGSQIQTSYGTFDSDITVPSGKLTYKFGTWTPVDNSAAHLVLATLSSEPSRYVRLGRLVLFTGAVVYPATADGNFVSISVPFPPAGDLSVSSNSGYCRYPVSVGFTNCTIAHTARVEGFPLATGSVMFSDFNGTNLVNSQYSGKSVIFGGVYETAAN